MRIMDGRPPLVDSHGNGSKRAYFVLWHTASSSSFTKDKNANGFSVIQNLLVHVRSGTIPCYASEDNSAVLSRPYRLRPARNLLPLPRQLIRLRVLLHRL